MRKTLAAICTALVLVLVNAQVALADIASREDLYPETAESNTFFTLPVIVALAAVLAVIAARFIIKSRSK